MADEDDRPSVELAEPGDERGSSAGPDRLQLEVIVQIRST